jgi:hypothetical protein
MSRRRVDTFEQVIGAEWATAQLAEYVKGSSLYQRNIPLAPGTYRLNIVAKDVIGGNMTTYEMALNVPHFEEEKLSSSSLVLADLIEKVPTRNIGDGMFVIGASKVRPRLGETFKRTEKMGVYVQFYNFVPDEKTQKPNATVEYDVVKKGTNEKVFPTVVEEVASMPGASAQQYTVEKLLPLEILEPGDYVLKVKVTDRNANNSVLTPPPANFKVL